MYSSLWQLLKPFHRSYVRYLAGVTVRQLLLVGGGFSMVWVLRLALSHVTAPVWLFVAGLLIFDAAYLWIDVALNTLFASRIAFPMFGFLRRSALGRVFEMPMSWHNKQDTGALVGRVNNGVGRVVQTSEALSREMAPQIIRTLFSLVPLLIFSPWTTPAMTAALGVFLWLTIAENRRRDCHRVLRNEGYEKDFGLFAESVQYVQPVVQFGQTGRILRNYGRIQDRIAHEGMAETYIGNRWAWKRNTLLSVTKRACQGIWIWQYRSGALDAAMVMYLNMLTEDLLNSFWGYASLLERVYEGMEPTRLLMKLFGEKPAIRDQANVQPVEVADQVGIQMVNVDFEYEPGRRLLSEFNLSIRPGEIVGVVGRSGSGKTSLHNLLTRMFDVQRGSVLICGEDVRNWPLEQLRGLFSYVTQNGGVFLSGATVLDTIRFARPEASEEAVFEAAACACIHDDILRLPEGYETKIGQRGVTLSKGQQQRIALAQALVALTPERKVVILDEFTSALDSKTEEEVTRNLMPYLAGRTVIIIAHRLSTVQIADRIVVMDAGEIVEQGTHERLMWIDGWYSELARMQSVA